MSKLVKLQLGGIRSFGPGEGDTQQLTFSSPVTLILGQNGCGKTTIIEAVKYALSGELPAGAKNGQAFINDPAITGKVNTKGQVRLKIQNVHGDYYIIVKGAQLNIAGARPKFSRFDSTISVQKAGERVTDLSGRCGDVDTFCCNIMNLSKPILNDVIFCHQEDAAWPLEEGKKVKEKFDEIFDAQSYNKCSQLIRNRIKEQINDIKLLKVHVSTKKDKKEYVERQMVKLQEKNQKLREYRQLIEEIREELTPLEARLSEIMELETVLGELNKELSAKTEQKNNMVQQQELLKERLINEFEGSDEELSLKIADFSLDQEQKEKMVLELEKRKSDIQNREKQLTLEIQKTQIKLGQLKEEKNQNELKIIERNSFIERAKLLMNLTQPLVVEENGEKLLSDLKSVLKCTEDALNDVITERKSEENELQIKIDEMREKSVREKENTRTKKNEVKEKERKMMEINNKLQELKVSDNTLSNLNRKIEEINKSLAKLQESVNEEEVNREIKNIKDQIQKGENKLADLEQLYRVLQQNYVTEERLESEKQTKLQKETDIEKLKRKHASNLADLFPDGLPESLKKSVDSVIKSDESKIKNLNAQMTKKQKEVTTFETQLQNQKVQLKNLNEEVHKNKAELESVCKGKKFDEVLKESNNKKDQLQKRKGQLSSAKIMYEKFIKQFQSNKPCCPVCHTDFVNKTQAVAGIINDLRGSIIDIPNKLQNVVTELAKEEKFYNKLHQLSAMNESTNFITEAKLPLLEQEHQALMSEYEKAVKDLNQLKSDMEGPTKNVEVARNLQSDAAFLDQYKRDIKTCESTIRNLEDQLKPVNSNKTKHEVEAEIDVLRADISSLREKDESTKAKLDKHRMRCQGLRDDRNRQVELQLKCKAEAHNKPHFEKQFEELEEQVAVSKIEIVELEDSYNVSQRDLSELLKRQTVQTKDNQDFIKGEERKNAQKAKIIEDIEKITKDINAYTAKDSVKKLENVTQELTEFETKNRNLEEAKNKIIDAITLKKESIAKNDSIYKSLQNNVTLREKRKEELKLAKTIDDLTVQIGNHNYRSVYAEKKKIQNKCSDLDTNLNTISGKETELEANIEQDAEDLDLPENRLAGKNYLEKLAELKVNELVEKDLLKYVQILENSVLQFHKEVMVQINRRIRELWRSIYRGNDIDYIEIKTEDSASVGLRRTYNYKVVQVKGEASLDMRGRCSAGQRVLACLVIRMALAESFSTNCGILTLDEPTTNLDRENIASLTEALAAIILNRQEDDNFQLVVITHDEHFLDGLKHAVQDLTHYWKISRNDQGFSVIKKENF